MLASQNKVRFGVEITETKADFKENLRGEVKMKVTMPMMGKYTHNIDAKNRFFIPAKHREALGATFVIYPNIRNKRSLIISSLEYLEYCMNNIRESKVLTGKEKAMMIQYLNSNGDTLTPDSQGRVVIASSLVELAGLGGATVIEGCYDHAEIYAAEVYHSHSEEEIDYIIRRYEEADL